MKRILLLILIVFLFAPRSHANHTKGGWMYYEYLGQGINDPGKLRYKIGLNLYIDCNSVVIEPTWNFSFFKGASPFSFLQDISVNATNSSNPEIATGCTTTTCYPCISSVPTRCYKIINYETIVELDITPDGYIISKQRCCRIAGINNITAPSNSWGETYTIKIPGTNNGATAPMNSSPKFIFNDTAVVCNNSPFTLDFSASDADGDSLTYSFCSAYFGGDQSNTGANPTTASTPPYSTIPYQSPYSGSQPLGASVGINSHTGLISGIAPPLGEYVLCVCVFEYRNGVLIAETRKEIHLKTADCNPLKAQLNPRNTICDGFTVNYKNDYDNPANANYLWIFGEPTSGNADTSILPAPSHTYANSGVYTVKLKISLSGQCTDSASYQVRVFPGFYPGFVYAGGCFTSPFQFFDTTKANYGVVNSWSWNFGDLVTLADTSHIKNPAWTYSASGTKTINFIVTSSVGCIDTIQKDILVYDKPVITLGFRDTLICHPDIVQLNASGNGIFSWTPLINIINANTATPTVRPVTTTWYVVQLNDNGCVNKDSVRVRVVNFVSLIVRNDTTICLTDNVQLNAVTDGLQFQWTPAATLNNPNIVNPLATPVAATSTYQIIARIGSCTATDNVTITTVPYPVANAGPDPTICYNKSTQLNGSHNGSSFSWSPVSYLNNPTILNPIATPPRTTTYVLTSFDNKGCPKPGRDTVVVIVLPRVRAFAGRDTSVVIGQPLQFNGTGGIGYVWTPATGLNNPTIANPIGIYGSEVDSIRYKLLVTDQAGCADSAYITVTVFKTVPSVFVPTAFTPNNDGLNDVIRPIAVGISRINYFSVYNRWGQLVFTTTVNGKGWDGKISGKEQGSGVFVWMVSAVDYSGKSLFMKGTVTLIR